MDDFAIKRRRDLMRVQDEDALQRSHDFMEALVALQPGDLIIEDMKMAMAHMKHLVAQTVAALEQELRRRGLNPDKPV